MLAVARSFAWAFWTRHRFVSTAAAAYLGVLVLVANLTPAGTFEPGSFAVLTIPLFCVLPVLLALFSYGENADLLVRDSGYPARSFTLPLRTRALVGWPMALGAMTMALFWLALAGLVLRPAGVAVPVLWPAICLAALLVWTQALMWHPFPLPALRVFVTLPVLGAVVLVPVLGHVHEAPPALLLAFGAALIPPGYVLAVAGLARARCGDVPIRRWPVPWRRTTAAAPRPPFRSAAAAMAWLEWGRAGYGLPLMVLLTMVPHAVLLYFAGDPTRAVPLLLAPLLYPMMMAMVAGAGLGTCGTHLGARDRAMPAFLGARPVTSAAMLAVKLRVAARAALLAWAVVAVVLAAALALSPIGAAILRLVGRFVEAHGGRGVAVLVLVAVGMPALTWKWIVSQLWVGLTGRTWVAVAWGFAIPLGITVLAPAFAWLTNHPADHDALLAGAPWAVGIALALKLTAGAAVVALLLRRRLVPRQTLAWLGIAWVAAAVLLLALACWLVPPELASPTLVGSAAVLVGLPLVRLGAAPLALDWNRHR